MPYPKILVLVIALMLTPLVAWSQDTPAGNAPSPAADSEKADKPAVQEEQPSAKPQVTPASLLAESDSTWNTRHRKGNSERSLAAAEEALAKGADEFEAQWRIARACFWIGERTNSDDKKAEIGMKGVKAGERAIALQPNRVEGYFWGVVSLGQYSTGIGIFKAFFKGVGGQFEEWSEKAIKLDSKYAYAGPTRAYGRYWFKVPKIKRDLERAEKLMKQSIKDWPKKLRSHFYLAEIYLEQERDQEAKAELETCLSLDPKQEEYPDGIVFKKECQTLFNKKFK